MAQACKNAWSTADTDRRATRTGDSQIGPNEQSGDRGVVDGLRFIGAAPEAYRNLAGALLLLVFAATVTGAAAFYPAANWDLVAYVATVIEPAVGDIAELHGRAWAHVRDAVTPGQFVVLTEDRPYRVAQYTDPAAFATMLGFYRVKWLYVETAALLAQFVSPVTAIRAISAGSAALIGLLVLWWLALAERLIWAPLAVALLVVAGYGDVARLATPDGMATVFFLVASIAFLRHREWLAGAALFAAFLVRPDHLAFIGVLAVVGLVLGQRSFGVLAALAASAIAYVPLTAAAGHPGWWIQFWFTAVSYVPSLDGFDPGFSPGTYLFALAKGAVRSLVEATWPALIIVALAGWAALEASGRRLGGRQVAFLVAIVLTVAAKFVLLPVYDNRFHFPYMIAMGMVLIAALPRDPLAALAPKRGGENASPD